MRKQNNAVTKNIAVAIAAVVVIIAAVAAFYVFSLQQTGPREIKIGLPMPLTGPSSVQGRDMKMAAEEYIAEINEKGGLLGAKIIPEFCDDESKAEIGVACIEKFAAAGIKFVLGTYNSHVALPSMDAAAKREMIYVITVAASDEIPRKIAANPEIYRFIFKTNLNASSFELGHQLFLIKAIETGQFKPKHNPPRLALITEDTAWGKFVGDIWRKKFEALGWDIMQEITPFGATDYYSVLTKVKQFEPDVIKWEISSVAASIAIVKQLYELELNKMALVFSDNSASATKEFADVAREVAPYLIMYASYPKEVSMEFERKGVGPFYGHQRVAMEFFFEAVKRAGTLEDLEKIAEVFENLEYKSIRGVHKFTWYHEQIAAPEYIVTLMQQVQNGKIYYVWPDTVKEREFILPPWLAD